MRALSGPLRRNRANLPYANGPCADDRARGTTRACRSIKPATALLEMSAALSVSYVPLAHDCGFDKGTVQNAIAGANVLLLTWCSAT
jgi:hypothetical protein